MRTKWMLAATVAVFGLGAGVGAAQDGKPAPASRPAATTIKVGDTLDGATKLRDLDGVEKTVADYKGKVLVLAFYSIKCPYMKPAEPKLKELHKAWAGQDVVFLAVNANKGELGADPYAGGAKPKETYVELRAHLKANEVAFPMIADHGNKLADQLQAATTPHCFVFDKAGVLKYAGALDDDSKDDKGAAAAKYLKDAVDAVLKGEKPKTESTKPYGCSIKREAAGKS